MEQLTPIVEKADATKANCLDVQKEMLPSKLVYFMYYSALGGFLPYCNIFLVSVGLSTDEAGLIIGLSHAFSAIGCPLWGFLADWTNQRSLIFVVLCIGSGLTVVAKPFVSWTINVDREVFCLRNDDFRNVTPAIYTNNSIVDSEESKLWKDSSSNISLLNNTEAPNLVNCTLPLSRFNSALFFINLFLFTISEIFYQSGSSLIDSATMTIIRIRKIKSGFGAQRVFGAISYPITCLSAGLAADAFSHSSLTKYTPSFCIALPFFILVIPIGLISIKQGYNSPGKETYAKVSNEVPAKNNYKPDLIKRIFKDPRNVFFFFSVFVCGILDCVQHSFLFLLMNDSMNASKTSMGVAILVGCTSEIFMLPLTSKIIRKVGSPLPCIELGVASHCVRFLVLSYCENAWASIPAHLLHSMTWALLWSGEVEYVDLVSPASIHTTMFGVLTGMHFSVPSVFGNMVGGFVYRQYGGVVLFRSVACIAGVRVVVMFLCFHVLAVFDTQVNRNVESDGGGGGGGLADGVEKEDEVKLVASAST